MNTICENCGQVLKYVKAGISKSTGKPYSAFMACPNQCPQPKITEPIKEQEPDWGKIRNEKQMNIAASVAVNNAVSLVSAGKLDIQNLEDGAKRIFQILQDLSKQPF
jgi:phosphoribosylaminoimidazole-succinocarboxamide synthase